MKSQVLLQPLEESSVKVTPFISNEPHFTTNASILAFLIKQKELIKHFSTVGVGLEQKLAKMKDELSTITSKAGENGTSENSEPLIEDVRNAICKEVLDYDYKLNLMNPLPTPICKGKYMSLAVEVAPIMHESGPISTVSVSVSLFTSDSPPVLITQTASGRSILKGNTSTMVVYDTKLRKFIARFRIQIREVSSRFKNGWIFMVLSGTNDETNSYYAIRPLVIKRIVVKAKDIVSQKRRNI